MKKIGFIIGSGLLASTLVGCSGSYGVLSGPDFEMRGSAEGLDAFYQGHQGLIEGSKHEVGAAPYTQETYRQKEVQRTYRSGANPFAKFLGMGGKENGK